MKFLTIGLVDDHSLFRKGLRELIENSSDHKIILEAGSGKELMEQLISAQPDLLLMDLKMPDMDGIETTKALKKNFPKIKIVVLSMYNDEKFMVHLMEIGANGYLVKSAEPEDLLHAIDQIAKKGNFFSDEVSAAMAKELKQKTKNNPSLDNTLHLTKRELEVLPLICKGFTNAEIGNQLFLATRTVEGYRQSLIEKTGNRNTAELVAFAYRNNLVD